MSASRFVLVRKLDAVTPEMLWVALYSMDMGLRPVSVRATAGGEEPNAAIFEFGSPAEAEQCVDTCRFGQVSQPSFVRVTNEVVDRDLAMVLMMQ